MDFAGQHVLLAIALVLGIGLLVGFLINKLRGGASGTTSGTDTGTDTSGSDATGQQTLYVPTQNTFENIYSATDSNNNAPVNSPTTINDPSAGGTVNAPPSEGTSTTTVNAPTHGRTVTVNPPPVVKPPTPTPTPTPPPPKPTPPPTIMYEAHLRAKTSSTWDKTKSGPPLRVSPSSTAKEVAYPKFGSEVQLLTPKPTNGWYEVVYNKQHLFLSTKDVTGVSTEG